MYWSTGARARVSSGPPAGVDGWRGRTLRRRDVGHLPSNRRWPPRAVRVLRSSDEFPEKTKPPPVRPVLSKRKKKIGSTGMSTFISSVNSGESVFRSRRPFSDTNNGTNIYIYIIFHKFTVVVGF